MRRRDGRPLWVDENQKSISPLNRIDLRGGGASSGYDEAWLQALLHRQPEIFPIEQIEPGFGDVIPLCRELPVTFGAGRSGALDNLYATADGGLVLVEAKLWRNPEARRSVVAQAMEYAAAIFRMSYDELEKTVIKARTAGDGLATSLFEIVSAAAPEAEEVEFVDALARNLARGRAVIAVVGDGIREDIAPLAELLQSHAGNRFTFALVELGIFETPSAGVRLVIPSVLAKTTLIERGVVRIEGASPSLRVTVDQAEPATSAARGPTRQRSFGITEDEFFETLGRRDVALPELLKAFLTKAEDIGIEVDLKGGLSLKHASPIGQKLNLGTISKDGYVNTSPSTWWGRRPFGDPYNQALAEAIGGFVREAKEGEETVVRTSAGKMPQLTDLLPAHEAVWLDAMQRYVQDFLAAAETADE